MILNGRSILHIPKIAPEQVQFNYLPG